MESEANTSPTSPRYSIAVLPFVIVHLVALAGLIVTDLTIGRIILFSVSYLLGMFGVTAGYHRYFSHRTYKTSRVFQFVMALLGTLTAQKGVLWWAAHHRHHHKHSDQPEDLHSPAQRGLWWSHVGWILARDYNETRWDKIRDLAKYPELRWLNEHYLVPAIVLGFVYYFIGGGGLVIWGVIVPIVALWHATFCINSLTHLIGRRRYQTTDDSKNSLVLALLTLGEGWHNNHHHYAHSAKQGFFWWEIDLSYYGLKALSWVGLVWDLRDVPEWAKEGRARRHAPEPSEETKSEPELERLAA